MSAPERREPRAAPRHADDIPPRYELKYLVHRSRVDALRRMLAPFARLDQFAAVAPDHRYVITSLYLDTPHLGCWHAWNMAADRRFKLRIRRYGQKLGDSPVFFEIKERVMDVTLKPRVMVPPAQWLARAKDGVGTGKAERDFCNRRDRYRLQPTLLVRYEREAWAGISEAYTRVTFDQRLQFQRCDTWTLEGDDASYRAADDPVSFGDAALEGATLVEIKFEREVPRWLTHVIRSLELERSGCSKYGIGVRRTFDRGELLDATRRESTYE